MFSAGDTVRIVKIDEDEFTLQDKELIGEEFEVPTWMNGAECVFISLDYD